jgi:putative NIF3 family GTP cyclohydrolase 1 type 2
MAFVRAHNLVVWRFHDSWHDRRPDGILAGMVHALGWEKYQSAEAPQVFTMPETTLGELAKRIRQTLDAKTLRFIGDPAMKVTEVGLAPGFGGFATNRRLLQRRDVQVEVLGEGHEWEIASYAADAATAQLRKGIIVVGHIPSEQAGMDECARWLKTFISGVPVEFVPAREAFVHVP